MPKPQRRDDGQADPRPHGSNQSPFKDDPMTRSLLLTLTLLATPFAAAAMPGVGDIVGSNAEAATAALEKAGCPVAAFESEDGKIEAICTDAASGNKFDVTIDPATGAVLTIKDSND